MPPPPSGAGTELGRAALTELAMILTWGRSDTREMVPCEMEKNGTKESLGRGSLIMDEDTMDVSVPEGHETIITADIIA